MKLTIEQVRTLKNLVDEQLERQDPNEDKSIPEYIEVLEVLLKDLSLIETEN